MVPNEKQGPEAVHTGNVIHSWHLNYRRTMLTTQNDEGAERPRDRAGGMGAGGKRYLHGLYVCTRATGIQGGWMSGSLGAGS